MSLTAIDPVTALVIIDLQRGIVAGPLAHSADDVIGNAIRLARAFRERGLPVVPVHVEGGASGRKEIALGSGEPPAGFSDFVEGLVESSDHTVTKHTWGAFTGTDLDDYLRERGVTQIVLAGISTSIGVESTARFAFELGYNVTLATDAMTDRNAAAHENSVTRIFPRLGETGTTDEVLSLLP